MFTPISRNVMSWETPDPDAEWIMRGHLVAVDSGIVLVDPPVLPGLIDAVRRLGKAEAVIVTTLDHLRGAGYISEKTGAALYLPDQDHSQVDETAVLKKKRLESYETYSEGKIVGLEAYRLQFDGDSEKHIPSVSEFALLTPWRELITGDAVTGTEGGNICIFPEWYSNIYNLPPHQPAKDAVASLISKTHAASLLASHGHDIIGALNSSPP